MSGRLENKVSVITGGGSGIGKSIATRFAGEGSLVYVLEINKESGENTEKEIRQNGGKVSFIHCDVSDEKSVKNAIEKAFGQNQKIDILVNNAGVSHIGNIEKTSSSDMDRLYQINVKSVFLVTKEVIGKMVSSGGGIILNMASIASKIGAVYDITRISSSHSELTKIKVNL